MQVRLVLHIVYIRIVLPDISIFPSLLEHLPACKTDACSSIKLLHVAQAIVSGSVCILASYFIEL